MQSALNKQHLFSSTFILLFVTYSCMIRDNHKRNINVYFSQKFLKTKCRETDKKKTLVLFHCSRRKISHKRVYISTALHNLLPHLTIEEDT